VKIKLIENLRHSIVVLKEVTRRDCKFLYELLKSRESKVNISHRKMPTYSEHVRFVMSKPYSKWYVIYFNSKKAGSIYLSKQDEVGIFLKKNMKQKGIGTKAMNILMELNPRSRYLANVNPKNTNSINFFKKNNFELLQHTYELRSKVKFNQ